jgi:F-box/LRR-repeat protein 18 C-terminal
MCNLTVLLMYSFCLVCYYLKFPNGFIVKLNYCIGFEQLQMILLPVTLSQLFMFFRYTCVEGCYHVTELGLKKHIQACCQHITVFNLNHCYWISAKVIKNVISKCQNLSELHVIQCRLSACSLSRVIATMRHLTALSFSVSTYTDISRSVFATAEATLRSLGCLNLYYATSEQRVIQYVGEQATFLDFCISLETLTIDSSEVLLPELFRPVLHGANMRLCLTAMQLDNAQHAGALMLFYGVLTQLPTDKIKWRSLLLPDINIQEFVRQPELIGCFNNVEHLRELDMSGSKLPFTQLDFSLARNLLYLNVAGRILSREQLNHISFHCHQLISLNIYGCPNIFSLVG